VSADTEHDAAQAEQEPTPPRRADNRWKLVLGALIGGYVLLGIYYLISFPFAGPPASGAKTSVASPTAAARTGPPLAVAAPPVLARPVPSSGAAHALNVAAVTAFGPEGTADGDNAGIAYRVTGESTGQPWYTQWYASATFGNLRAGTGLLLDMGKPVTVTSVRLVLGSQQGADVQVWVGNSATMSGLSDVASTSDAGGAVRLAVTPSSTGRYVLVWFTRLPPNGQPGQYQVDVYGVTVDGTDL
jgi:hypothetical protein